MIPMLFGEERAIRFSYFEALGVAISDCLVPSKDPKGIQIGEGLDGRVICKGLSEHPVGSAHELAGLVEVAKSRRSTAATERNDSSSRSHGVAVLTIGEPGSARRSGGDLGAVPTEGRLYVIDLAGSERAADSKGHTKARMVSGTPRWGMLLRVLLCATVRVSCRCSGHPSPPDIDPPTRSVYANRTRPSRSTFR